MADEVAAWKAQQRTAMAQQLQLEEESLARLEAAAAASGADGLGGAADDEEDESVYDAPGHVKVRNRMAVHMLCLAVPMLLRRMLAVS